jgi:hypothetical protein
VRIRSFISLAGLLLLALAACTSSESDIVIPSDGLGTLSGSVTIGPLCPVQPCSVEIGDTYSSRQVLLQSNGSDDIVVFLNQDGTFQAEVPAGDYVVNLSTCEHLGCSSSLPVEIAITKGETYELNIDIDTGIRSPVGPPASDSGLDADSTARRELSARLGVAPEDLTLVHFQEVEFSNGGMGCPDAGAFYTQAIIPGFSSLYEVDGVRYPFHISADGRIFTDCRWENNVALPFRLADKIVEIKDAFQLAGNTGSHLGAEVALQTLAEAEAYLAESNGRVEIDLSQIDWPTEMLVGTVVTGSGCSFDVVTPLVFLSHPGPSVDVYVDENQTGSCEKAWAQPVWLVIQEVPSDYSASFTLSYTVN